jgi:hypothetical protein
MQALPWNDPMHIIQVQLFTGLLAELFETAVCQFLLAHRSAFHINQVRVLLQNWKINQRVNGTDLSKFFHENILSSFRRRPESRKSGHYW